MGIPARLTGCSASILRGDDHHWAEFYDAQSPGPFGDFWHTKEGAVVEGWATMLCGLYRSVIYAGGLVRSMVGGRTVGGLGQWVGNGKRGDTCNFVATDMVSMLWPPLSTAPVEGSRCVFSRCTERCM